MGSVKSDKQEILDKTASAADIAQPNCCLLYTSDAADEL